MAVINRVCVAGSHNFKGLSEGEVVVVNSRLEGLKVNDRVWGLV